MHYFNQKINNLPTNLQRLAKELTDCAEISMEGMECYSLQSLAQVLLRDYPEKLKEVHLCQGQILYTKIGKVECPYVQSLIQEMTGLMHSNLETESKKTVLSVLKTCSKPRQRKKYLTPSKSQRVDILNFLRRSNKR